MKPTSIPGTYPKYTEEAFEAACDMSLQAHYDEAMKQLDEATPNDQSVYRAAIA